MNKEKLYNEIFHEQRLLLYFFFYNILFTEDIF